MYFQECKLGSLSIKGTIVVRLILALLRSSEQCKEWSKFGTDNADRDLVTFEYVFVS